MQSYIMHTLSSNSAWLFAIVSPMSLKILRKSSISSRNTTVPIFTLAPILPLLIAVATFVSSIIGAVKSWNQNKTQNQSIKWPMWMSFWTKNIILPTVTIPDAAPAGVIRVYHRKQMDLDGSNSKCTQVTLQSSNCLRVSTTPFTVNSLRCINFEDNLFLQPVS